MLPFVLFLWLHTHTHTRTHAHTCVCVFMLFVYMLAFCFPCSSNGKESACNAGDLGLTPESGRSPGEGNDNPLQHSCLENPMDRGAWWATVCGVAVEVSATFKFLLVITHTHKADPCFSNVHECKATSIGPPLCCEPPPHTPSSPRAAPRALHSRCAFCFPPSPPSQARGDMGASHGWGHCLDPRGLQAPVLCFCTAAFSAWHFPKGQPRLWDTPAEPWVTRQKAASLAGPLLASGQLALLWPPRMSLPILAPCPGWPLGSSVQVRFAYHTVHPFGVQLRSLCKTTTS